MIFLIFSFEIEGIHSIEYFSHLNEADFSFYPHKIVPLKERKGLYYEYYGYCPYWIDTTTYKNFRFHLLTHISYFSVGIDTLGNLGSIPNSYRFSYLYSLAHSRGVKMHITYTIFGSSNVSKFLNNKNARNNAISQISSMVTNYGLDGVNIDFEFVQSSVKDSFSKFINDLYYEMLNHQQGRKELYIAMPAVPPWYPGYDYAYLSSHSDGLFIMAYDYHYSGSSVAGPVSPTIPSSLWGQWATASTIKSYLTYGATRDKLILGIPYYGFDWPTTSSSIGSSTRGTGDAVVFRYAVQNAQSYGRLWDTYSLTPWYEYYVNGDGWHQCWYDDSFSLYLKFTQARDSSLKGSGCWALGYDDGYDDIWNAIQSVFWIEPPSKHFVLSVNISDLNTREGPGTDWKILTVSKLNQKFVGFKYLNNWYKIYFPSDSGAYYAYMWGGDGIDYQYLKGSTGDTIVRVTASLLNVREGPGTSNNIITRISFGQVFVLDSIYNGWARIYIPPVDTHRTGWCSLTYLKMVQSPEDSNEYDATILKTEYPDTLFSLDTFTLKIKVLNNGSGPFDNNTFLYSFNSPFYDSLSWTDRNKVITTGYDGLPNQTFYRYGKMRAPFVSDTTIVQDTFRFYRKNIFGGNIILKVVVLPEQTIVDDNSMIHSFNVQSIFKNSVKFTGCVKGDFEIKIYDVSGRLVFMKKGKDRIDFEFGDRQSSGIYFYEVKTEKDIIKGKVIKLH
uniref:T9SS type A sorting domain-containing protein n=1 Tax=candidate division WOR-3 bacterium TaxID=2052148 RepID=A0A7C4U9H5_UNCW3